MVLFGELVEPISRALWDDDFGEYPENTRSHLEWKETITLPDTVEHIVIVETPSLIEIIQKCILINSQPLNELDGVKLQIYSIKKDSYIILCHSNQDRTFSEITEAIAPLLEKSKGIYCLTSAPTTLYQMGDDIDRSVTFIRHLSCNSSGQGFSKLLEPPNLVTGLGAGVLSYSVCKRLPCYLYIIYLEVSPLDSVNTRPVLNLLESIGIEVQQPYTMVVKLPSSNMYM